MYRDRLGTDWDSVGREEALHRAFALGVASVVGEAPEGELDRLREQVTGRYDESLIELAYEEGVAEAEGRRGPPADRDVWGTLVEDGEDDVTERVAPPSTERVPRQTDRPSSLDLPALVGEDHDELEKLDLPAFLR